MAKHHVLRLQHRNDPIQLGLLIGSFVYFAKRVGQDYSVYTQITRGSLVVSTNL